MLVPQGAYLIELPRCDKIWSHKKNNVYCRKMCLVEDLGHVAGMALMQPQKPCTCSWKGHRGRETW